MVGGWVSLTVTEKLQLAVLPTESVAVEATTVVPTGNIAGETTVTPLVV